MSKRMHVPQHARNLRTLLSAAASIATVTGLYAQQAADEAAATEEDIVVLSPFEVSAETDRGYVATDSLAGTRIRTELKDIGSAVSVITKDLMNDIGATDSGSLLQYTTNTEVAGTKGTFSGLNGGNSEESQLRSPAGAQRVRGLAAADTTRDYFVSDIPWDSYNVDRIDILRGPNSFLFGLGSPSGIQNASMQTATYQTRGVAEARIGSYGSKRATLNYNHVLIDDVLAIRVAGLWDHEKFRQDPAFEDDERVFATLRWDPKLFKNPAFKTSIKVKYEVGDIDANRPRTVTPFDRVSTWFLPAKSNQQILDDWGKDTVNPFGGLGRAVATDPYAVERTDSNIEEGDGWGIVKSGTDNYNPWMGTLVNAQQPYYTIDGASGTVFDLRGGWINAGALNSAGGYTGASAGVPEKRYSGSVYVVNSLSGRANAAGSVLPNAQYGGYRDQSLTDASIFDFYNNLIDGPNKSEWQRWTAYNIDLTQTGWDDRVGLNLIYDRQRSTVGNEGLLGWGPTINIDLLQNYDDYYLGTESGKNANFGRPFVTGTGSGSQIFTDREYQRASLFAELRVSDLTDNKFLVKLLGKHRFNGVYSKEKYYNQSHNWQMYANSQEWAGYWNGTDGSTSNINDRVANAMIYLGPQITGRQTAAGANIPRIGSFIDMPDMGIYVFDPRPAAGVDVSTFANAWVRPAGLENIIGNTTSGTWTQASNLDNLVGWNDNFGFELIRGAGGENTDTWTKAQRVLKKTTSWAGSYQGYFWNNAFVATLGWRYDKVKQKNATAWQIPNQRSQLNLTDEAINVAQPYTYGDTAIAADHSFKWQGVMHLNRLLKKDPLPFNVSLSYVKSDNFEVSSTRRDLYGNVIDNPSGETKEYGVLLGTKDGKYSLRVVKYETRVLNSNASLGNGGGLGSIITNGLNWRNVFLYELGAYDLSTANQPSYRNRWTNAYPGFIQDADGNNLTAGTPEYIAGEAQAIARMNEAIRGWNDIQKWLTTKGFFQAWSFTPLGPDAALVDRDTYRSNPSQYAPNANTVTGYAATAPAGFNVTSDTISKGYEFEFTANPLPNWRIAFNASKTNATRENVGGATLTEFIEYMDSMLYNADGSLTAAAEVPRWGGAGNAIGPSVYAPWKANYTKMKLMEGTQADEIRKWRFNVISNYSFNTGRLKGVGVGAAYRWQDKNVIGYPMTADGGYDLGKPYYGPSEDAVDTWISYERKLTEKINWKIQLNVRNLFADDSLIPTAVQPDGYTWATVRVSPNREWFLTNTFTF